jgi:hypothetical protein
MTERNNDIIPTPILRELERNVSASDDQIAAMYAQIASACRRAGLSPVAAMGIAAVFAATGTAPDNIDVLIEDVFGALGGDAR